MRGPHPPISEPIDPETVSPSRPFRALKQAGLVLLCAAWVLLGLVGHDPWKTEDALAFGSAWEMLQRGDFLVPHIAHLPSFDRAPLAAMLSAATLTLFSPPLQAHDAARFAAAVLLVLTLGLVAWTARELNGRAFRWVPVLILIGSIGLFDRAHQMSPELGLMFAVALGLYGIAMASRRPAPGGALLGLAIGVGFLAYGFLGPLWIGSAAVLLPLAGNSWRTGAYALTLAVAVLVALPLATAWPLLLWLRSPELFETWRQSESLREYLGFLPQAAATDPMLFAKNMVWFAWPAWPLVVWTLWVRGRGFHGGWNAPGVTLPVVMSLVILVGLCVMPAPRIAQALPLLVPLALLASVEVDSLERGMSAALDWFGILTFGLAAVVVWGFWIDSYVNGMSPRVALLLRDTEVGYGTSFKLAAVLAAASLTALWITLVRPARRSNRRAILNWAAGITLIWGLVTTIWLPYIDSRRSYRPVAEAIAAKLPSRGCVASRNVADPQRALFYYFSGIVTVPDSIATASDCSTLLVQYGRLPGDVPALDGWKLVWDGARRGDNTERFGLYVKVPS